MEVPCLLVALSLTINIVLAWLIEWMAARQQVWAGAGAALPDCAFYLIGKTND